MRVVLASASPRRRELLAALLPAFDVAPADIPEPFTGDPVGDAVGLALTKAKAVATQRPGELAIGADTVVFAGSEAYAKPEDAGDAVRMWRELRGCEHAVVTGIALAGPGVELTAHSVSRVTLSNLDEAQVAAYVASGRPMDKAGAYAIQDEDVPTVTRLEGCYCNVMGLPLWRLRELLARAGCDARAPGETFERCRSCPERDVEPAG